VDAQARAEREAEPLDVDYRPAACLSLVAVILTLHEYYGGRQLYDSVLRPWLRELDANGHTWLKTARYDELYSYSWWALTRIIGYVLIPLPIWKLLFPKDSLLDMGLRVRGFLSHLWIYGLCLAVVIPTMLIVASQPDFGTYYPFYKGSSRSWWDLIVWELMYGAQFFALELFFRGWMLGALRRSMGSAAIFVMAVPYCMIHYGKPYLETHGAIVAGIVLGSLAMRTRSIYAGFLVHITVAYAMDLLALWRRDALPTSFWIPPG
jgi:membrane protease YdiL (CAAX protease family)